MEIFPALKRMDGENRQIQLDIIDKNFDIPYWRNYEDVNSSKDEDGNFNPYYFSNYGEGTVLSSAFLIVRYDKVTMRGRRKITFDPQYVQITQSHSSDGMPFLKCYENTAVNTGVYGKNFSGSVYDGWDRPLHPHISRNEPCLGSFENMLYKESRSNPVAYFTVLGKFYRTWNIDSCFWNINRMTPLYSEAGADNNRKVILDAKTYQRVRISTGTSDSDLRRYIPDFMKQGLDLVDCIEPIRVLGDIRHSWMEVFSNVGLDRRDRLEMDTDWKDDWKSILRKLQMLSGEMWQYYRQSIATQDRRLLRQYLSVIKDRYQGDFALALEERWKEVINTNLKEVLHRMTMPANVEGTLRQFNRELMEGNSYRTNWLWDNMDLFGFSNEEEMAYFAEPMILPPRSMDDTSTTFTPEDIISKLEKLKRECGKIAINKLDKQKEVIINEIKTLESNSIEDSILQQQISF